MIVRIVLWSLADSKTSVGELRRSLSEESADAFEAVEGLRLMLWLSDEETERWGAVYPWTRARPPSRTFRAALGS